MKNNISGMISGFLAVTVILGSCSLQDDLRNKDELVLNRQVIINDMVLPNDGHPAGVPTTYSWYHGSYSWWQPNMNQWAKGPYPPEDFTQIIAWGQVYADATLPNADTVFPDIRVHLKDMELWILQQNNTWIQISGGGNDKISGAAYVEDFVNDVSKPADIRDEDDGGISVQAGSGFNFHFWPRSGMQNIDSYNIKGILVVCKARLIGGKSSQNPKYLVSIGADYWKPNTQWGGLNQNNIAVGAGRHKYVARQWQFFTMHTFTPEETADIVFPVIR